MSKETNTIESEYHVFQTPDGKVNLLGIETYSGEDELKDAIKYNHSVNRNRIFFGIPSFLFSIAGFADAAQRVVPYIQTLESLKPDANLIGGIVELVISSALFAYSLNSLSQIRTKAREIEKVEFAIENPAQDRKDT